MKGLLVLYLITVTAHIVSSCDIGYTLPESGGICTGCAAGTYKADPGDHSC